MQVLQFGCRRGRRFALHGGGAADGVLRVRVGDASAGEGRQVHRCSRAEAATARMVGGDGRVDR